MSEQIMNYAKAVAGPKQPRDNVSRNKEGCNADLKNTPTGNRPLSNCLSQAPSAASASKNKVFGAPSVPRLPGSKQYSTTSSSLHPHGPGSKQYSTISSSLHPHRPGSKQHSTTSSSLHPHGPGSPQYSTTSSSLQPHGPGSQQYLTTSSSLQPQRATQSQRVESAEEIKRRLLSRLNNKCESPFVWRPRQEKPFDDPELIIIRLQQKDKEVKDYRKFKWRNFIFHLVICYELWRAKKLSQAYEEICGLESVLRDPTNRGDFDMFVCIEDALNHVVYASKAFLHLEQNKLTDAEQVIEMILPYDMMSYQNKAGIHGIRAAISMEYGHRGNKIAVQESMKAVDLNYKGAEWHFLVSKCLGRIRRVAECHELVYVEEWKAINKSVQLDKENGTYKVVLAQVLAEKAFREYKKFYPEKKSKHFDKIKRTCLAAKHKFVEAANLNPCSPRILIRCAKGLMKLPRHMKSLEFMKNCIDKAVELAPNNPMVHHIKGIYHERFDCDVELPLEAYEKAASLNNFEASMDLIRIHHKLGTGNIVEELETLACKFKQTDRLQVIYTQAGSYLLFIKKDIIRALKFFLKVIEIDPKSYAMMSHKSMFLRMRDPVNMFDVMLEELAVKTDWESFLPEDRKLLKAFRIRTADHQPLPKDEKKRLTVQEILEKSREIIAKDDLYKENQAAKLRRKPNKKKEPCKWNGKKKRQKKQKNKTDKKKVCPDVESTKQKSKDINSSDERKRRDSVSSFSSVNSVDSDYVRDSTVFGTRRFFDGGSNQSLCSTKSEKCKREYNNERGLSSQERYFGFVGRTSSISSISSLSSASSFNSQSNNVAYLPTAVKSQLTEENLKQFNNDNSKTFDTNIRRLSMLSLSSDSLASQASSSNTLSVMDRVKQSYAMLGRNDQTNKEKKNKFRKHGSTQSLSAHIKHDQKKEFTDENMARSFSSLSINTTQDENIARSFSSLSINTKEENYKGVSTSVRSRFTSKDSKADSSRKFSFLPDFASKK